ncbi:MAG TPA: phosphotransferase [Egibacteraceae bacterium]|nr:phosphotransferase [Egibacteraceae bacterium]
MEQWPGLETAGAQPMPPAGVLAQAEDAIGGAAQVRPVGKISPWSGTWLLHSHGRMHYLKRVPRSRPEPLVLAALAGAAPGFVPAPLVTDLVPYLPDRWFLLHDVGDCDRAPLSPDATARTARLAGTLQRRLSGHPAIASLLAELAPEALLDIALECCWWSRAGDWGPDEARFLADAEQALLASSGRAESIASALAGLPQTVTHGDMWPGNIARSGNDTVFIDWGDAFWGVGAVDVVNLLVGRPSPLSPEAVAKVWSAFAHGLGVDPISERTRRAAHVAHNVASLMIDRAIAEAIGRPPQWLRGTVPGLRGLLDRLADWH